MKFVTKRLFSYWRESLLALLLSLVVFILPANCINASSAWAAEDTTYTGVMSNNVFGKIQLTLYENTDNGYIKTKNAPVCEFDYYDSVGRTAWVIPDVETENSLKRVTKIEMDSDGVVAPSNSDCLFNIYKGLPTARNNFLSSVKEIDLNGLDIANVTNMNYMFSDLVSLSSIKLPNWDTSNVTEMYAMFSRCSALTSLEGLSNWNTSNVTDMRYMFHECSSLASLDLSNWNTSSVIYMESMFNGCTSLTSLGDLSNWNTSNATNMNSMFQSCSSLTSLDLSNWDTSNANVYEMFQSCSSLVSLDLSNWNISSAMSRSFDKCPSLTSLNFSNWNISNLKEIDWSSSDPNYFSCVTLPSGDFPSFILPNWINLEGYGASRQVAWKNSEGIIVQDRNSVGFSADKVDTYYAVPILKVTYTDGIYDESVFSDQTYEVALGSSTPVFSGKPARYDYVFTGWYQEVADTVTKDVTYVAQWAEDKNNNGIDDVKEVRFSVTYTDGLGGMVFPDQNYYNLLTNTETPSFIGEPKRDGYVFKGWSPEVQPVVISGGYYVAQWEKSESTEDSTTVPSDPNSVNTGSNTKPENAGNTENNGSSATVTGAWKHNSKGWWYAYPDGTYAKGMKRIGNATYYFDSKGWMKTGWQHATGNSDWYYFNKSGAMKTGWLKTGGKWYYLNPSDGKMNTGFYNVGNTHYYSNSSGVMKTGWQKISNNWYYFASSGAMKTGWAKISGKWYYLNPSNGIMKTGWLDEGGQRYLLRSSGQMITGWVKDDGVWYCFNKSGYMQQSKWVGNYYVDIDGKMLTNQWVKTNGVEYYVNASGKWTGAKR